MLVVELNRGNFEYDVNALVRAFYPEEQVRVLTPETKDEKRAVPDGGMRMEVRLREDGADIGLDGAEYRWDWAGAGGEADGAGAAALSEDVCDAGLPEGDARRYKNAFKRFLYSTLSQVTGRELPWGAMTGIRPTKLAFQMLEQGRTEQEIVEHFGHSYFAGEEKARLSVAIAGRERELLAGVRHGGQGDGNVPEGYSLYVGIPFCPTTCLYCSFTSFPIGAYRKTVDVYIDCLLREMEAVSRQMQGRILDCVYIGGGTPTTLEAGQLDRLLANLKAMFDLAAVKEFTVEAGRADSITEEKLRVLRRHGVGRISVNPQTMNQRTLDIIGRKATAEQVERAYALARNVGFDNINMDLILGLPGEGEEDVRRTVDKVAEMAPDSLTVHSLAIKRASALNQWIQENGGHGLRNTEETMRIAAEGARRLGMVPYYLYRQKNMSGNFENVGYAKEGKFGLYNVLIMEEKQSIVACGAGAISKRVYPDGRIERSENVKEVALYMEKIDEMIERKRRLFTTTEL